MIKYKANYCVRPEVEKVEIEKETESSVWIKGRREAKETQYHAFFNTFQEAKDFLIDKGFDKQFGARPLKRTIQRFLEDPLAEEILAMQIKQGDILIADLDKEKQKIQFTLKEGQAQKEATEA